MSAALGDVSTARERGAALASDRSSSMSLGSERTTGPGLPEQAVLNARETNSAMREASSISATHFAWPPNMAR